MSATLESLRRHLPGVNAPALRGDNLAITLASLFEPGVESEELDDSGTWKQGAIDAADEVLDAIHAHYADAYRHAAQVYKERLRDLLEANNRYQQEARDTRAALKRTEEERDRANRNRDMWQAQCERQADQLAKNHDITIAELQRAHVARQEEWCPDQKPDLSFRGNEMAGEVGEACNVIKKLERERQGWRGSRATREDLADELADVIHTAVLSGITADIDLGAAVVRKFNATSEKNGLSTMLSEAKP